MFRLDWFVGVNSVSFDHPNITGANIVFDKQAETILSNFSGKCLRVYHIARQLDAPRFAGRRREQLALCQATEHSDHHG